MAKRRNWYVEICTESQFYEGFRSKSNAEYYKKPGVISFAGGLPAPELFPVEEYAKVAQSVIQDNGSDALQYGPTLGYIPLRTKIAERMQNQGFRQGWKKLW